MAQRRRARPTRVLLVDETSIRRRHRYVTVVACGESGKVLAMIPGRTKGSLSRFFRDQGAWWCRQVEIVVSDGILLVSGSYRAVLAGCSPCARPLPRRPLVHPRPHPGTPGAAAPRPPAAAPDIRTGPVPKPVSLCYAGPTISQTPTKPISIACSRLIHVLRTDRDALQELYQLYEAEDLDGANQALGRFADLYATGQIPEYHDIVDTIIAWGAEILAYHNSRRASNGPIEGINNLHQVLRRVAHGFTNPDNLAARGILVTS